MKILIVDRDKLVSQMIASRLQGPDYLIEGEIVKNDAIGRLEKENFDIVMIDPTPLKDAQALVMNIRRVARNYPYIIIMGQELDLSDVNKVGANNFLNKPLDITELKTKIDEADILQDFANKLSDKSEDFPSAGGVIAKSAFNELFLSAIDRGWRYAESAHILSVQIENYDEILKMDGDYHANFSVSKLAQHLVRLRRQSDVIGQTDKNEYSLLLQRTDKKNEAIEAAKRFTANIEELNDFIPNEGNAIRIRVALMEMPTGFHGFSKVMNKRAEAA